MSLTRYGIASCDTVGQSRVCLDGRGIAYACYDYNKAGVPVANFFAGAVKPAGKRC